MNTPDIITAEEVEARRMRDAVYIIESTDANWDACKDKWLEPDSIEFLKKHSQIKLQY